MSRVLAVLGGMSWVSTEDYYRRINQLVAARRGRQHSAELLLASVDFQRIIDLQVKGDWDEAAAVLAQRAVALEQAGAGAFLIASNTMHLVLAKVEAAVKIPALSIFDATAAAAKASGKTKLGLLGTRYTMGGAFYQGEYAKRGITVISPEPASAKRVNEIIFRELIHRKVTPQSTAFFRLVVAELAKAGVDGVILGCTELNLVLGGSKHALPLFDTASLHAEMAASWLLEPFSAPPPPGPAMLETVAVIRSGKV